MDFPIGTRVKNAWNAFWNNRDMNRYVWEGSSYGIRPDRPQYNRGTERTIISSIYNRIATDVSSVDIRHVKLDENGRFMEYMNSGLDKCLSVEANIDQTGRGFVHDLVSTVLNEGCAAILPVDTTSDPTVSDSYDILSLRVGRVVEWKPVHVKVDCYNPSTGAHEEIVLPKKCVGIVENPFYSVMNEPNSTMQRLVRKLVLLDRIDDKIGSNKLDLIIQLPYTIKGQLKQQQAKDRLEAIRAQLEGSEYGIAYIDSTERITQLNRPVENALLGQIEYLTNQVFSQLGLSQAIIDGTADEKSMLNYQNRVVTVLLLAITEEMYRKFLSKTARTQRQAIKFFQDPFRLVPVSQIAEIADKFTRNEIMTSNEIRQTIGMKPSDDPNADELRNKNLSEPKESVEAKLNVRGGDSRFNDYIKRLEERNQKV